MVKKPLVLGILGYLVPLQCSRMKNNRFNLSGTNKIYTHADRLHRYLRIHTTVITIVLTGRPYLGSMF